MVRIFVISLLLLAAGGLKPVAAQEADTGKRIEHIVDTPFYTMRGPEMPGIALIQTGDEVEYIGDYLGLDQKRSSSALRLVGRTDFDESMLLVVNGGPIENSMLRVESVFEENGELNVVLVFSDPPSQYRDSEFGSTVAGVYYPSLVTVLPRFQGRLVVHTFPTEWAMSGDLRGIGLVIYTTPVEESPDAGLPENE